MIKRLSTLLLISLAFAILIGAGAAEITQTVDWQKKNGDIYTVFYNAAPIDGGYYISELTDGTLSLVKTDANFKEQFRTKLDGSKTLGLTVLSDGGCIFLVKNDATKFTLTRMDKSGKILWESPVYDMKFGMNPVAVSGNNVRIAGWLDGTNTGVTQSFLLSNGNPANDEFKFENMIPMSILADGNAFILVGGTTSTEQSMSSSAWIMKLENGNKKVWNTTIRTQCGDDIIASYGPGSVAYALCKTSEGGYYVVGTQMPYSDEPAKIAGQIWGAKVSTDGKVTWQKDLYGAIPVGVAEIDGQYIIAGEGATTAYCYFVTPSGNLTRMNYNVNSTGIYYSLDASKKNTVVLAGCLNAGEATWGLAGIVDVFEAKSAGGQGTTSTASPVPVAGVAAGLLGALGYVMLRKK